MFVVASRLSAFIPVLFNTAFVYGYGFARYEVRTICTRSLLLHLQLNVFKSERLPTGF